MSNNLDKEYMDDMTKSMIRAIDETKPSDDRSKSSEGLDLPPFQCTNFPGWAKWVDSNTDPYGRAAVTFAALWAHKMEVEILKIDSTKGFAALTPEQIEECSKKADKVVGGISGFMFGAAVHMLGECWRYGKELRQYHNRQYGVEDSEGTVNPAVVTIG